MSKLVEPTDTSKPSMINNLVCSMVGRSSWLSMPACSSGSQLALDASRTEIASICLPGSSTRILTPRLRASSSERVINASGTQDAAARSIDVRAAAMAIKSIRCMLSLPPEGEATNSCASLSPAGASSGASSVPLSTRPVVLIQLSLKAVFPCATTGPAMRY